MRSSQPVLGSTKKLDRCKEDENLLKYALPMGKKGFIYDLRDVNTMKNAVSKGGGYETEAHYSLWTRVNRHCERYDQLHLSFSKLIEACCGDSSLTAVNSDKWLAKLEASSWFANIR